MSSRRSFVRWTPRLALAGILIIAMAVVAPGQVRVADAAAGISLDEPFSGESVADTSAWRASTVSGGDPVCLTARSASSASINLSAGVLAGCTDPAVDPAGSGVLRLTENRRLNQATTMIYSTPLRLADGLDITFSIAMYGDNDWADGIAFFLKDGTNSDDAPGATGGALGYGHNRFVSPFQTVGLKGALIGIGFDRHGNFVREPIASHCTSPATTGNLGSSVRTPNQVVIRGPDLSENQDGSCGYYLLGAQAFDFGSTDDRSSATRLVRVVVDEPSAVNPQIKVYLGTNSLPAAPTLSVPQPAEFATTTTFKFGFGAATGGASNTHEVWGLRIGASPTFIAAQSEAGNSTTSQPAPPTLLCDPDPARAGATVECTVTGGPADFDILWRASSHGLGGSVIASQGLGLNSTGTGSFTFIMPPSDPVGVELVDWGVTTTVGLLVDGALVPTRVPAGEGPRPIPLSVLGALLAAFILVKSVPHLRAGVEGSSSQRSC